MSILIRMTFRMGREVDLEQLRSTTATNKTNTASRHNLAKGKDVLELWLLFWFIVPHIVWQALVLNTPAVYRICLQQSSLKEPRREGLVSRRLGEELDVSNCSMCLKAVMTARILLKSSVCIARIVNSQPVMVAGGAIWEM
ncbi:MAG: hypothetical protein ACYS0I_06315 [Planctomycetota bacterium]